MRPIRRATFVECYICSVNARAKKASLADGVGFEPTDACTSPVFKTGALNHSATHPSVVEPYKRDCGHGKAATKPAISSSERRWTTRQFFGALAARRAIFAEPLFRVDQMNTMNSGNDESLSGHPSAMSGRVRPKPRTARRMTRHILTPTGRSTQMSMSARASRLGHVAEWPPSKIQRSPCSASWHRRVFSDLLRSTQPACQ